MIYGRWLFLEEQLQAFRPAAQVLFNGGRGGGGGHTEASLSQCWCQRLVAGSLWGQLGPSYHPACRTLGQHRR